MNYKTKVDLVYDKLMHDIINGKYRSGDRLIISKISAEEDISAIPVREALRRLESDGYVQVSANKGAIVNDFSVDHIFEIFQIKAVLEGYASRLSCDVLTASDIAELREINAQLETAYKEHRYKEAAAINKHFHLRMYQDINAKELISMIESLWVKYNMTTSVFSLSPNRTIESVSEHEEILQAVEKRDPDLVEKLVRNHKMKAGNVFVGKLHVAEE